MDLLRFATAGSVDDGKSTLIGRMLYDSKSIFSDQLESIEKTSKDRGDDYTDLSLLTDGLRAEREQGITIDVAYRYFSTPKRKFVIADTPGHIQYTRNMVTGASTADAAVVLVDARKGLSEQSRRHAFLVSLLQVPHLVLAINKMDLVDWSEEVYESIRAEFVDFAAKLEITDLSVIPVSALLGDNVVTRSENMPWYHGPTLLHHMETLHIASDRNLVDVRFPVQYVIRPHQSSNHDYRGYAGQMCGGVLQVGDEVLVLPSGLPTKIASIMDASGPADVAFSPMSVTICLEDDLDISRGDMICRVNNQPSVAQDIDAMVCWMSSTPMAPGQRLAVKHTTRNARALVKELQYELNVNTLHRNQGATELKLNEVGRVRLRTTIPLLADEYRRNRQTGAWVLLSAAPPGPGGAGCHRGAMCGGNRSCAGHWLARHTLCGGPPCALRPARCEQCGNLLPVPFPAVGPLKAAHYKRGRARALGNIEDHQAIDLGSGFDRGLDQVLGGDAAGTIADWVNQLLARSIPGSEFHIGQGKAGPARVSEVVLRGHRDCNGDKLAIDAGLGVRAGALEIGLNAVRCEIGKLLARGGTEDTGLPDLLGHVATCVQPQIRQRCGSRLWARADLFCGAGGRDRGRWTHCRTHRRSGGR
ncbi:MAG: sulfate adenylyltransferase subunit 1 [Specibacter sp.]